MRALLYGVVDALDQRSRRESHDPIGYADGNDADTGRCSDGSSFEPDPTPGVRRHDAASQYAQRSEAMAAVRQTAAWCLVSRVVRFLARYRIALQILPQPGG